ncbi:hypothetical protein DITRI_Ditri19aG0011000 [Diplodiscus trichospermus]
MCMEKKAVGLGFRRLQEFNIALLGKQAWRLRTQPDLLVSKVFRAWYFPNSTFLEAKIRNNPSYVWRSIFAAQELIRARSRRRIGNGMDTFLFKNPWLPSANPFISIEVDESLQGYLVSLLFTSDCSSWDNDLVADIFNDRDRELILGIPLNIKAQIDIWY